MKTRRNGRIKRTLVVFLALGIFFMGSGAAVAGVYDGLWYSTAVPGFFLMVRANADYFVGVIFAIDDEALVIHGPMVFPFSGPGAGTTARTLSTVVNATADLNFSSESAGSATIVSCSPPAECDIPVGVPFPIQKLF
jgi:hypothetical protein